MNKVDLVMWTKNGEKTLPQVLDRINNVIPESCVNNRFIVDDRSRDHTREIAVLKGWAVLRNEGTGICDGANTALKYVETERFCSFEQDLLLYPDWWSKLSLLQYSRLAAVSGIRFASQPRYVADMQHYVYRKYLGENGLPGWLRSREASSFTLGKTLDNTLWDTETLREVGGFPNIGSNGGIDTVLAYKLQQAGYVWVVDYAIQSLHLRPGGFKQELKHQYSYGTTVKRVNKAVHSLGFPNPHITVNGCLLRLIMAPFTGVFMAWKTHSPQVAFAHPFLKLQFLRGVVKT